MVSLSASSRILYARTQAEESGTVTPLQAERRKNGHILFDVTRAKTALQWADSGPTSAIPAQAVFPPFGVTPTTLTRIPRLRLRESIFSKLQSTSPGAKTPFYAHFLHAGAAVSESPGCR